MREPLLRSDPSPQYASENSRRVEKTGPRYQPEAMVARERLALRRSEAADPIGRFGDPPIEPALTILVNSLETEADLHPHGRFLM